MVPVLTRVVEHGRLGGIALGRGDDLVQGLALQRRIFLDEAIQRGDIGLMVLAVVQVEGFLTHAFRP